jgi:prevent-host-death family protein
MHAAKTNLSALVKEAAAGEPFAIAINGKPMVKVIPFRDTTPLPRVGFMKGQIAVPDDFDDIGKTEIIELFGGAE